MKKIGGNRKKKKKWRKSIIIENIENIKKKQKETKETSNIIIKHHRQITYTTTITYLQQIYTNYTKNISKYQIVLLFQLFFNTIIYYLSPPLNFGHSFFQCPGILHK